MVEGEAGVGKKPDHQVLIGYVAAVLLADL
jgi:hypothetical protein